MFPCLALIWGLSISFAAASLGGSPQLKSDLDSFFLQDIRLTPQQIAAIRAGQAVSKALPSRNSREVFLFGAIHINTDPERYVAYSNDFERLRKLPNYLAIGVLGSPPADVRSQRVWVRQRRRPGIEKLHTRRLSRANASGGHG